MFVKVIATSAGSLKLNGAGTAGSTDWLPVQLCHSPMPSVAPDRMPCMNAVCGDRSLRAVVQTAHRAAAAAGRCARPRVTLITDADACRRDESTEASHHWQQHTQAE